MKENKTTEIRMCERKEKKGGGGGSEGETESTRASVEMLYFLLPLYVWDRKEERENELKENTKKIKAQKSMSQKKIK